MIAILIFVFFLQAKAVLAKVGYPEFIMNDTYIIEGLKTVSCVFMILIVICYDDNDCSLYKVNAEWLLWVFQAVWPCS